APASDLWWKNAVVYCLHVGQFAGDLPGLIGRLDHVAQLGASCVWLMPFYPSPRRDDGYDVADYQAVDPRFGDLGDLVTVVRDEIAKAAGLWLELGVSGLRMDAVPFLVEEVGVSGGDAKGWLHDLRELATRRRGDAMLMGEVNVGMEELESFFEDHGDALHL